MNASNSTTEPASNTAPTTTAEGKLARRIRQVSLGLLIAAAGFVAYRLGDVWAEWRELSNLRPDQQSLSPTGNAMAAAMLPLAGQWSFDDLDWGVQSTVIDRNEVTARLATFATSDGGPTANQLPDVSPEFLKLARDLHIAPVSRAGNELYMIDRPELKGQLVTRNIAGRAKVISLAAAMQQDGDQWRFYELSPHPAAAKTQQQEVGHLLPLPAAARRNAGRFGEQGELLLEIVELESSADQLLSKWRDAGWEIHSTGLGDADSFSYLCARGNETIYVWSADQRELLHSVMLVRNPEPVDTKAQP